MSTLSVFVGREKEIADILSNWHTSSIFLVYGLRSIGKSTLIRKYLTVLESDTPDVTSTWIDMRSVKHLRQVYISLLGSLSSSDVHMETDWMNGIAELIKTNVCSDHVIIFDNAEDTIDYGRGTEFQTLCKVCISSSEKVKVIVTSTTEFGFKGFKENTFSLTLSPLSKESSAALLQTCAPSVNFGTSLVTIANLCGGFPLAILMTASILEDRDALFTPSDMVDLLQLYRLKVLSQDAYQRQERIAIVYGEFLKRLSGILTGRLSIICYIPGSFTIKQVTEMIGHKSDEETKRLTLAPVMRHHVVHYDQSNSRYDVHGLLRDCIEMFQDASQLPETRKRFCQIFARLILAISEKVDSSEYLEGLCLYNLERQNFQKLLTDVIYTTEDTYGLYMELAIKSANVIHKFIGDAGVQFYQDLMTLCRNNKKPVDEACVRIQFGSMLTNIKGKTLLAEENYVSALDVLSEVYQRKTSGHNDPDIVRRSLALVYQRIGWNVGSQGRWLEALVYLDKALHLEEELHMHYEELAISTVQSLAVFNTFMGNLDLGLKFNKEALRRRTVVYGTEEHPNVAALFNNLGLIYLRQGRKDKCLECFKDGLRLKRKTKATAKSIAISLENVALAFTDLGDYDQAHKYLKEAYDLLDKTPNLYRDNRAYAYSVEGRVLQKQARHTEAISKLKKSASIIVHEAPDEIFTSKLYFEIANSYFALENYTKALAFCKKVFSSKQVLVKEAPTCDRQFQSCLTAVQCHVKLGDDQTKQQWYDEATREATRLIQIFRSNGKEETVSKITNDLQALHKRLENGEESK